MRKALKRARKDAVKSYSNALEELSLIHTIPKDHEERVYLERIYETCGFAISDEYNDILSTRSVRKIRRVIDNIATYTNIWHYVYSYYSAQERNKRQ